MSEGEFYNIEKILDRRKVHGKYEYKIKWEGYSMNECTWEPMKNLESAKELVDEYNRSHPISNGQKTNKKEQKKKDSNSFINKKQKRKEEKEEIKDEKIEKDEKEENGEKIQEESPNEKQEDTQLKINFEESKPPVNEKRDESTYVIDDSLKKVLTVKQQNQKLMAFVEKLEVNGEITKTYIPTEELRKTNPWILLDFYESKIKFT